MAFPGSRARNLAVEPRLTLVRPLLTVSRRQIQEYLGRVGQPFREDETNTDLRRTRSRIRHDLLPKLEAEYNPRIKDASTASGGSSRPRMRWCRNGSHRLNPP